MGTDNLIYLEILEWFDETGQALVHRLPEKGSGEIKFGAQLIVRESQAAVFFYQGRAVGAFGPGRHTLKTANIPILTKIASLPWAMESPLKAEVYFINLKTFTNLKWGTRDPVAFKDKSLGLVRLRARLRHWHDAARHIFPADAFPGRTAVRPGRVGHSLPGVPEPDSPGRKILSPVRSPAGDLCPVPVLRQKHHTRHKILPRMRKTGHGKDKRKNLRQLRGKKSAWCTFLQPVRRKTLATRSSINAPSAGHRSPSEKRPGSLCANSAGSGPVFPRKDFPGIICPAPLWCPRRHNCYTCPIGVLKACVTCVPHPV